MKIFEIHLKLSIAQKGVEICLEMFPQKSFFGRHVQERREVVCPESGFVANETPVNTTAAQIGRELGQFYRT